MRKAGRIVREVLDTLGRMIRPGITTKELDDEAARICVERGGRCLFKGVPGHGKAGPFPGCICVSLNEELVHGLPSDARRVADGDVITVDFGVELDGWCGDAAETYIVGEVAPEVRRLVDVTRTSLELAIRMCRPGQMWSAIAAAMQEYIGSAGFAVVRDFVGHGIGRKMWEDPKVPNFVLPGGAGQDFRLEEGLVIAIEPMVNMGSQTVEYMADGWTVVTKDRLPSAHFENTVAITSSGTDCLTDERYRSSQNRGAAAKG